MALDNLEAIRIYRARVEEQSDVELIGVRPGTMLTMLDTLLGIIEEQDRLLEGQKLAKQLESVEVTPLHKRRKLRVDEAPDLE